MIVINKTVKRSIKETYIIYNIYIYAIYMHNSKLISSKFELRKTPH